MTGETEAQNTLTSNNDDDASEKVGEEDGVGDDDEEEEEPEESDDVRRVLYCCCEKPLNFCCSSRTLNSSWRHPRVRLTSELRGEGTGPSKLELPALMPLL